MAYMTLAGLKTRTEERLDLLGAEESKHLPAHHVVQASAESVDGRLDGCGYLVRHELLQIMQREHVLVMYIVYTSCTRHGFCTNMCLLHYPLALPPCLLHCPPRSDSLLASA